MARHPLQSHRWRQIKAKFRQDCEKRNDRCHLCKQPIDYSIVAPSGTYIAEAWEPDHVQTVKARPDLALMVGNLRASHAVCNKSRGEKPIVEGVWVVADW